LQVTMLMRRAGRRNPGHAGGVVLEGFGAALAGHLAAALLSAPTISSIIFYLQLGCVTGTAARMMSENRRSRAAVPRPVGPAMLAESPQNRGSFA
jgi:uncharacterized membrane protein